MGEPLGNFFQPYLCIVRDGHLNKKKKKRDGHLLNGVVTHLMENPNAKLRNSDLFRIILDFKLEEKSLRQEITAEFRVTLFLFHFV